MHLPSVQQIVDDPARIWIECSSTSSNNFSQRWLTQRHSHLVSYDWNWKWKPAYGFSVVIVSKTKTYHGPIGSHTRYKQRVCLCCFSHTIALQMFPRCNWTARGHTWVRLKMTSNISFGIFSGACCKLPIFCWTSSSVAVSLSSLSLHRRKLVSEHYKSL